MSEELVCIKTYLNAVDADVAKEYLESNGIQVTILGDTGGGMLPDMAMYLGVRVHVKEEDAERASELLAARKL